MWGFGQGELKWPPCLIQADVNWAILIKVWECSWNDTYSANSQESFTLSLAGQLQNLSTVYCTQLTQESSKTCLEHLALVHPAVRQCAENKAISMIIHNEEYCAFFRKHASSFVLRKSRDTPWFTRRALAEAVELETYLWWQMQRFLNRFFNLGSCTELPHPTPANTILDMANIWKYMEIQMFSHIVLEKITIDYVQ